MPNTPLAEKLGQKSKIFSLLSKAYPCACSKSKRHIWLLPPAHPTQPGLSPGTPSAHMSILTHEPLPNRPHLEKASESEHILMQMGLRLSESSELAVPQAQRGQAGTEGAELQRSGYPSPTHLVLCHLESFPKTERSQQPGGHDQSRGQVRTEKPEQRAGEDRGAVPHRAGAEIGWHPEATLRTCFVPEFPTQHALSHHCQGVRT